MKVRIGTSFEEAKETCNHLPESRILDLQIAVHYFGWVNNGDDPFYSGELKNRVYRGTPETGWEIVCPHYSSNDIAVLDLLPKLSELYHDVEVSRTVTSEETMVKIFFSDAHFEETVGPTFPLAVCRAAMKACVAKWHK